MFSQLDDDAINYFLGQMSLKTYAKNQMVFDHGDVGDEFFVILEGQVQVLIPNESTIDMEHLIKQSVTHYSEKHSPKNLLQKLVISLNFDKIQIYLLSYFILRFREICWCSLIKNNQKEARVLLNIKSKIQ